MYSSAEQGKSIFDQLIWKINMKRFLLICCLFFTKSIFATSLMFLNDSPFKLDCVIINALGNTRGTLSLDPQQQITWYDQTEFYTRNMSPTVPYTVIWYCKDGSEYGIWLLATSGSMVTAQGSSGQKICKIKKLKPGETNTNIND